MPVMAMKPIGLVGSSILTEMWDAGDVIVVSDVDSLDARSGKMPRCEFYKAGYPVNTSRFGVNLCLNCGRAKCVEERIYWSRLPVSLTVQCPKCKTLETLEFMGDRLLPTQHFIQKPNGTGVYHTCGSNVACWVLG